MRLYLVRHSRPQVAQGVCYGASDVLCSDEALESAASALIQALPQGLAILSSPLSRCERLAQHLCRREASFAYQTDQKLAEMHFGAWEMMPWDQIAPQELADWTDAFASYRCGGTGESTAMFLQRVAQRLHASVVQGADQIWITHAGVIRAVQWLRLQPPALLGQLIAQPDPGSLLSHLRAADWPKGEVAWCQVHLIQTEYWQKAQAIPPAACR
jgi:alpha-ribazole phosphatase